MSDLIAVAYDDLPAAERARDKLVQLQKEHVIELADLVVVERKDNGKVKLHQARNLTAGGALGGAAWGGLIGLIFFMPLLGMAIGGATGAALGAASDIGVDDAFMRDLGEHLVPGAAAVFVLVDKRNPDKVIPEMAPLGGRILRTSLSDEAEQHLRDAVKAARTPQPA
ncbi:MULTISPECIES: DUF1269 domain-containing protein [Actinomadura]|uniref:DUF1269 domain-containing protein n=1 Tax=Actinomadura litoris TaxID=2678616 RepID=A0A7K1L1W6_9ACTN|nr:MULTISPECIES: DUF1269 domain-containing protein [Actinomadura]MBT2206471.1 DUF1269 domain-containing protein [Actinomadura sp. NEAU-AAG7]MUN38430.1 DUF1269 domain-containing protein [Actinomadura litoris]